MQLGQPLYVIEPPEPPPPLPVCVHVHVACGQLQSTLYTLPSLQLSLAVTSHGGTPPSGSPPLLPPPPMLMQTMGAGESRTGVASTGSPPELLDDWTPELLPDIPPELLPDMPPELLPDPGPPSVPWPPVLPPHAKTTAGAQRRITTHPRELMAPAE